MTKLRRIVIAGGGTAGWMAAAAFSRVLTIPDLEITLVESDQIGTVGVGEATIPVIRHFNQLLGLDEDELLKATQGTFKLGIEFVNWRELGHRYIHPFGGFGRDMANVKFHQFWLKLQKEGRVPPLEEFSLETMAARQSKFMRPARTPNSPLSTINYAYHFDATLYAAFLRTLAEKSGVRRIEGRIAKVRQDSSSGHVTALLLENGGLIEGDLFIDCTGFRSLLIEEVLETGYEDWSDLLPCDRAFAVQTENVEDPVPYTRSTAHSAGWQWRIPLQHRTGNGHVYSSRFMSDDQAREILLKNLDGPTITDPRLLKFTTGRRKQFWNKNVIAIGLAAGFLEPLESTSIHMIQTAIYRIFNYFPTTDWLDVERDRFNKAAIEEYESIRDFLILHYHITRRSDSEFWNYCRLMDVPQSLKDRIALFEGLGRVERGEFELFKEASWLAVMEGQGLAPAGYDPLVDTLTREQIEKGLASTWNTLREAVGLMPSHQNFIDRHCRSGLPGGAANLVL